MDARVKGEVATKEDLLHLKSDLDILKFELEQKATKEDLLLLKADLQKEIQGVRVELKEEIQRVRVELK